MSTLMRKLCAARRKLPADGRLLVGFLIAAALSLAFLTIASEVAEGDTLAFDRSLVFALRDPSDPTRSAGPAWLTRAMVDVTALGGVNVLTLLTLAVAGYLLAARKAATALFVVAAIAGGAAVGVALKAIYVRPRPDVVAHLVQVDTTSFPSGHATNSAVVFLTLATLLASTRRDRATSVYLVTAAIVLTLLVGASRVYLGVHWPSDVVAGWCIGAAWAAMCSLLSRVLQARRRIEPPGAAVEADASPASR